MPTQFSYSYQDDSKRIKAWTKHYIKKGCHPIKAQSVAYNKVRRSSTWP